MLPLSLLPIGVVSKNGVIYGGMEVGGRPPKGVRSGVAPWLTKFFSMRMLYGRCCLNPLPRTNVITGSFRPGTIMPGARKFLRQPLFMTVLRPSIRIFWLKSSKKPGVSLQLTIALFSSMPGMSGAKVAFWSRIRTLILPILRQLRRHWILIKRLISRASRKCP